MSKTKLISLGGSNSIVNNYITEISEPTGFPDRTASIITFDNPTRTFTITPTGDSFNVFIFGTEVIKSSAEAKIITDTVGLWYFYYDASAVLTASQTRWDLQVHVPIATVYWDGAAGDVSNEQPDTGIDWMMRIILANTQGLQFLGGFQISGYTLDTDSDAAVQFGLADGLLANSGSLLEVIHAASPSNDWEQILEDPAEIPIYYPATGKVWAKDAATTFAFKNTSSGRINWVDISGANGVQTEADDGDFVAVWIFAAPDPAAPIISVQGIVHDGSLSKAQRNNKLQDILDIGMPFESVKILYRLIFQTDDTFTTGARYAKLIEVADMRGTPSVAFEYSPAIDHSEVEGTDIHGHPDSANYDKPMSIQISISGKPAANKEVHIPIQGGMKFTIPSGMTNSVGYAVTDPAAQTDIDVQKNDVSAGTIRFSAASNDATFIMASETEFDGTVGDRLTLVFPAQDADLADLGITIAGIRS